jgi:hypothetical protein
MPALVLAALLAAPAHAGDETVQLDASLQAMTVSSDASAGELADATVDAAGETSAALALGLRLDAGRFYGSLEGRGIGGGLWTGRVAGGLDLLKRVDAVDIDVGLFGGAGGGFGDTEAAMLELGPLMGVELGLGVNVGRFGARYRHSEGLSSSWREEEVRLGFDVLERTQIFARYNRITPQDELMRQGLGLGVAVRF